MNSTISQPLQTQTSIATRNPRLVTDNRSTAPTTELVVFIDGNLADYELLLRGIAPSTEAIYLQPDQDGIAQISAVLADRNIHSIQILAHGSAGRLQLGNSELSLETLPKYQQQLSRWQTTDLLLYSCEVGADAQGHAFLNQLHQLTGANIGATAHIIGQGNWELEIAIGKISSTLALNNAVQASYPGTLVTVGTASTFATGSRPHSVTIGDFNGDGKADFATANFESNNISVFLGTASGGLSSQITFSTGLTPGSGAISVIAGDFNGDGKADLATANFTTNTISVLLGNGSGSFSAPTTLAVGVQPNSITVADFNGDGKADIVTANRGSNTVSVLLGGAAGAGAQTTFATGAVTTAVTVGDFNNDGKMDIATANKGSNTISVLLGNGSGSFGAATTFATTQDGPVSIVAKDLNGDGKLDIATTNKGSKTISVFLANASGNFSAETTFSTGTDPTSIVAGDFNGDGKIDLSAVNYSSNNISVLLGNGSGGFTADTPLLVGGNEPVSLVVKDLNGDGKLDFITANRDSGSLGVLLNTTPSATGAITITLTPGVNGKEGGGNGTFIITLNKPAPAGGLIVSFNTTGSTATFGTDYNFGAGANITGVTANTFTIAAGATTATFNVVPVVDAIADPNEIVKVTLNASPNYLVAPNPSVDFRPGSTFATGTNPRSVNVGDFNGDGKLDVVVDNFESNNVSVLLGNGSGGFSTQTTFATGLGTRAVIAEDFNGDGKLDIVTANRNANTLSILLGNGSGSFSTQITFATGTQPVSIRAGDFNGDGKLDLVTANRGNKPVGSTEYNGTTVSVFLGNGSGSFSTQTTFTTGLRPVSVRVGDFNGDGKSDIVTANFGANNVSVLLGNGSGGFGAHTTFATGTGPGAVVSGDFNGDGKLDFATADYFTNNVSVFLGTGSGGFSTRTTFATGTNPNGIFTGDFNGDGKIDLATPNVTVNTISVLLGNGSGGFSTPTTFVGGDNPYIAIGGDFNSDGKTDIISVNSNVNNILLLSNNSDYVTIAEDTGTTNTAPVVANPLTNRDILVENNPLPLPIEFTIPANTFSDAQTATLSLAATLGDGTALPTWLTFNGTTGKFSGTPPANLNSTLQVKVTATDAGALSVFSTFNLKLTSATVGDDVLVGTAANNSIDGLAGNDTISGGDGNDILAGGDGNDIIDGGTGNDTMTGGTGNDTYKVDSTGDVVSETSAIATEIDTVESSVTYTLGANLENLLLTGTSALNGTGNILSNTLTGNTAANTLDGGTGNDTMTGGTGNDTYKVDSTGDVVSETSAIATEIDTVEVSVTYTLGANLEKLTITGTFALNGTGNTLNNTLAGNTAANTLDGGTGNDTMTGGTGNDTYKVDSTGDVVSETSAIATEIDTVEASVTYTLGANLENLLLTGTSALNGTGNILSNTLTGNTAANTLSGGEGNDTYIFNTGDGQDIIQEAGSSNSTLDTVKFGALLTRDKFEITKQGEDLVLKVKETTQTLTIKGQFGANVNVVERFEFNNGATVLTKDQLITETPITNLSLVGTDKNILKLGSDGKIKFTLKQDASDRINQIGFFKVDDLAGTINGIAANAANYATEALKNSKVIFSTIANRPQGFDPTQLSRVVSGFGADALIGFYAIQDDGTKFFGTTPNNLTFKASDLGNNSFNLNWKSANNGSLNLDLTAEKTTEVGAAAKSTDEGLALDFSQIVAPTTVNFTVYREAAYNNSVGLYKVLDAAGSIQTAQGILKPGDAGYIAAAVQNAIDNLFGSTSGLGVTNQGTANIEVTLGKSIYMPIIVADGTFAEALSGQKLAFTSFAGANSDKTNHIRLLGDNTFGFEDLVGGGDKDYNDIIIKAQQVGFG